MPKTPACTGKDMLAELQQTDPAALAKLEAEADATANGKGLLWKIEKAGRRAVLSVRHHAYDRSAGHHADAHGAAGRL